MAVDVKQLRIGSHISINGERVEVESLQGGDMVGCITPDNDWFATESWRFESIPITSTLLKELGFEWREDPSCWRKKVGKDYWIFANGKEEVGWQFLLFPPYEKIRKRATLYADNLHEIEGQLVYYGVELIKE